MSEKLISSIPANNEKIVELYQKLQSGRLNISPEFQRKLVWRRQHKIEFIETILKNFPFPEIYLAPEKVDIEKLELRDMVVDGQQRLTAIKEYIAGTGAFAQSSNIPSFAQLEPRAKEDFLNYEVSIRYLKNANPEQIKEIFQRINRTDYSLNRMERFHAAWGDSELLCLAKQVIEKDLEINLEVVEFKIPNEQREWLLNFFGIGVDDGLFSEAESSRMLALQYILVLLVTMIEKEYFHRNTNIETAVQKYNEQVPDAELIVNALTATTKFISELQLPTNSIWYRKSCLFTLIVELSKYNLTSIDLNKFKTTLADINNRIDQDQANPDEKTLADYTREAVNEKKSREFRGVFIDKLIRESLTPTTSNTN